jgi:phosphate transport system permease protein
MKEITLRRKRRRKWEEGLAVGAMRLSVALAALCLGLILAVITWRGIGALSWEMLTQPPEGGFYLGKGGGILHAIVGSIYLALGATLLASLVATPAIFYLHSYRPNRRVQESLRLTLDILWGIPSIVYGAFAFALMIYLGMRASLLAGMIALAFVVLPILARTLDEVLSLVPRDLPDVTLALGATRWELAGVLLRQSLPGFLTALLLAFSRGIGDAAAVLFTAGFTDAMPESLWRPVASLPLTIFFLLGTPFPEVQARAYAAALVLTFLILSLSLAGNLLMARLGKHVVR